jgi:phenylacetate-CoA ligase
MPSIIANWQTSGRPRSPSIRQWIGRLDDMFIVFGLNVFPSDVEFVIRQVPALTGEYRIRLYEEEHLTRFDLEIEALDSVGPSAAPVETVSDAVKSRLGLRPKRVTVFANGTLPRTTHNAKRVIDERPNAA